MSGYYLAPALVVLRAEIDTRWPRRDRTSDGWIGDARHQATQSDHNPNERGSVDAIDVDEDGLDFAVVFAAIKRHPSARYVIYERKLYHRLRGWRPEPYSGVNPHDKHFHVSIDQTREAEQDRRPWGLLEDDMLTDEQMDKIAAKAASKVWSAPYGPTEDTADVLSSARVEAREAAKAAKAALEALAARPPVEVDYDQLADAIVRRILTGGTS